MVDGAVSVSLRLVMFICIRHSTAETMNAFVLVQVPNRVIHGHELSVTHCGHQYGMYEESAFHGVSIRMICILR